MGTRSRTAFHATRDGAPRPDRTPARATWMWRCRAGAVLRHCDERRGGLTSATALCLGRWPDARRLAQSASGKERTDALVLAALNGNGEARAAASCLAVRRRGSGCRRLPTQRCWLYWGFPRAAGRDVAFSSDHLLAWIWRCRRWMQRHRGDRGPSEDRVSDRQRARWASRGRFGAGDLQRAG